MKYVLSAIGGAMAMFLALVCIVSCTDREETAKYEHIDYVSAINQSDCFICGDSADSLTVPYQGQDNVGIVNLNTFEMMQLEINRYDDQGELIEEPAGYMTSIGLSDIETDSYAHAYCFPDNTYASLEITGVKYVIDRDSVENQLCQKCLDSINSLWFTDQPLAEYAVISFENRTVQPLLNAQPWFAAGNFGIDCEFKEDGAIDLLVHYCPNRYK